MSKGVLVSRLLEGLIGGPCIYECWERSTAKNYRSVSLVSVVSKAFEKFVNNRIVDHLEKCSLFPDQLQIFSQLFLKELLGLLTVLGLLELYST